MYVVGDCYELMITYLCNVHTYTPAKLSYYDDYDNDIDDKKL